ncbi:mandelate racemase/muconate lactonizing enzyme family protein [Conexibacter stalactiti]|uniref:Mandelate racemase/muconate lactonizing enzyme family protein n=1 Tax=Conexibacter stalactiti TaxID=1940611 RepID=A0ABU4HHW8_9ACTN|nr:mandelate racemase/muconate lactonizing enzyme family protein [Conexibacter stalactiti]MDW5592911.1 mandelate racemase/muconate lactonizing enzyme family protein [Conexibacter stalactiti]MEC5033552.1 mandelate racemase/muconate lactonizing enzyme family protein [Conexibacter stalactiti]
MSDAVRDVRVTTVRLALPQPLRLGPIEVVSREYAAITVTTADGLRGHAYCLTREAPVAALVERLVTPHLVGRDPEPVERLWDSVQRANMMIARSGLALRAIGLADVALWDIRAQRAGVPLWQLLARERGAAGPAADGSAPALLVAAYPTPDRTPGEIAEEVLAGAARGFARVKISRDPDPARMRELIERIVAGLPSGCELVVDCGFVWRDADEALAELAQWGNPRLAWLEDPLVPEDALGTARVRRESGFPIGAGDEVTEARTHIALLDADAVDVLRVDLLALGGVTPALDVLRRAAVAGVELSFHVYPEISAQLAAAQTPPAWVELFDGEVPGGNPYDPAHRLSARPAVLRDGRLVAPDATGLGLEFDRELVR